MFLALFWVLFLLAIIFVVMSLMSSKPSYQGANGLFGILLFSASTFIAMIGLGYGHVPPSVEDIGLRLKNGIVYQLAYSEKQGDGYVLVVKKFGTDDTLAIRTDTVPPEIFTLVNGQPVEVKK